MGGGAASFAKPLGGGVVESEAKGLGFMGDVLCWGLGPPGSLGGSLVAGGEASSGILGVWE